MKTVFLTSVLFLILSIVPISDSGAQCEPGSTWTVFWTDIFNQTTYKLEAPCWAYLGIPFDITATVTDSYYPDDWVGAIWSILDNGGVVDGGGWNMIWTTDGQWQRTITQTYSKEPPINHTIEFSFLDLGQGSGGHNFGSSIIGSITVDPYPPAENHPPVADAGPDFMILSENQNATIVHGIVSDADGDALTFRWLEGSTEIQTPMAVGPDGGAPLSLGGLQPLSPGSHVFTLEVYDGHDTATDYMTVSLENTPPLVSPSGGGAFQIGQDIVIGGYVADFDGDFLTYVWTEESNVISAGFVSAIYGGAPVGLPAFVIAGGLPFGNHVLALQVSDGVNTVTDSINISVIDAIAPTLSPVSSAYILWPPDNRMVDVMISANAADNSGLPSMLSIMISSSEPAETDKFGNVISAYTVENIDQMNGLIYLKLRAARYGKGSGRVYTVTITATDGSMNSSSAVVAIKVPHDNRPL